MSGKKGNGFTIKDPYKNHAEEKHRMQKIIFYVDTGWTKVPYFNVKEQLRVFPMPGNIWGR